MVIVLSLIAAVLVVVVIRLTYRSVLLHLSSVPAVKKKYGDGSLEHLSELAYAWHIMALAGLIGLLAVGTLFWLWADSLTGGHLVIIDSMIVVCGGMFSVAASAGHAASRRANLTV